ncbi:hypothetical protein [Levilactobacillus namurensis]|uniref:Uncharacterized protein n=1 Tax=Levilactobacillus namurensis TaxID=380393 RepID=A0AAW8W8P9_9LACO|nr:hypothetical protein [Levilactobacillus namurensis]MDT7015153.1 hypothetical protein [Levilactobacillus namurensis]
MNYLVTGILQDFILTKDKTELIMAVNNGRNLHFMIEGPTELSTIQSLVGNECGVVGIVDQPPIAGAKSYLAQRVLTAKDENKSVRDLMGTLNSADSHDLQTKENQKVSGLPDADVTIVFSPKQTTPSAEDLVAKTNLGSLDTKVDATRLSKCLDQVSIPQASKPVVVTTDELVGATHATKEKKKITWNDQGNLVDAADESDESVAETTTDDPLENLSSL